MVKLTAPYIPSFLGFREADILSEMVSNQQMIFLCGSLKYDPSVLDQHFICKVSEQKMKDPSATPGVLMVDGNGLLHPRYH